MKNKPYFLSLLGLIGVVGLLLGSVALSGFLAFLLVLPTLLSRKSGAEMRDVKYRALRDTAVFALVEFGGLFFLAALIASWPMAVESEPYDILLSLMSASLSVAFAAVLAFFSVRLTLGCLLPGKRED